MRLHRNSSLCRATAVCLTFLLSHPISARAADPAPDTEIASSDAAEAKSEASTTPVPQPSERRAREYAGLNKRVKEQVAGGPVRVAFLGDSITEGWSDRGIETWNEHFAPLSAINLGIGGDETQHVLWRIDHGSFDGYSPDVVVLLVGTNNLGNSHQDAGQTANGIRAVVHRLLEKFPRTKILLLGVFPRGAAADDPYRRQIKEINTSISQLEDNSRVFYLDIAEEFTSSDGSIPPEIMFDALHLSPAGYEVCADAIAPKVKELSELSPQAK